MKRIVLILTALGMAGGLAACGQGGSEMAGAHGASSSAASPKTVKAAGTVMAVDAAAGLVTINHQAIPEVGWPAMTMAFKAAPQVLQQVQAGDKIAFDLKMDDGGEVLAIRKE